MLWSGSSQEPGLLYLRSSLPASATNSLNRFLSSSRASLNASSLSFGIACDRCWIFNTPMNPTSWSWKHGTMLVRVIANGNYIVERLS